VTDDTETPSEISVTDAVLPEGEYGIVAQVKGDYTVVDGCSWGTGGGSYVTFNLTITMDGPGFLAANEEQILASLPEGWTATFARAESADVENGREEGGNERN